MSSSTPTVSPLRQRMLDDMRMRKLDAKTQAGYIRAVRKLAAFLKRSPDTATVEDLRALPAAPGRHRHLADHDQRDDHRPEVLLRHHARPRRADGQDAAGAPAAQAAGGAEPRRGRAPDRRGAEPQAPDGAVGGLRRRPARQRSHRAQGRRHRQPAHDAARRAGQGPQGPLRHALARAAASGCAPGGGSAMPRARSCPAAGCSRA